MQILKLHDMKVDLPRPKLLAARRLDRAVIRLKSSRRTRDATDKATAAADRGQYSTMTRKREAGGAVGVEVDVKGVRAGAPAQAAERRGTKALRKGDFGGSLSGTGIEDAPPLDAELMGIGVLPFVWYEGCVKDLELFGNVALETDEVASSPDVSTPGCGKHNPFERRGIVVIACCIAPGKYTLPTEDTVASCAVTPSVSSCLCLFVRSSFCRVY